ncbi:S41 family peptidase [Pedobacter aquatilis]|uniref:S41 family peptidase n=1 Tax=Pedobacter aquatilis TaxID=351343 RepID=UPI002930875B|nr:S41 family peptidase [Pedobacter aquatilis]
MKFLKFLFLLAFPIISSAQECNCLTNFNYVVQRVTKNYSGFADKVNSTNKGKFLQFTRSLRSKSKSTASLDSCYVHLRTWTEYFRDHHLRIQLDWRYRKNHPDVAKRLNSLFATPAIPLDRSENLETITSIHILDSNTVSFRLPSFEWSEKQTIDSLLRKYKKDILMRKNLILDIRGNSGGTDYAFAELMPLIYSTPIKIKPDEYLSTKENIRILEANLNEEGISTEAKNFLNHLILLMKENPNTFVNPSGKDFFETKLDSVYPNPSKVAILVDRNSASSAESFLLMAMQSKKVKVYGENSAGTLDYNNTQFFDIPCKDLNLVIPIGRSKRLPAHPIDNIGITPDFTIDPKITDKIRIIRASLSKN